jgi:acyl carrier protein
MSPDRDVAADVVARVLPRIPAESYGNGFDWLEIDSFDLVTLRVSLEEKLAPIPDETWTSFSSLEDIIRHFEATGQS